MLVFTRRSDEAVVVGGSSGFQHLLKVTVLGIRGSTVKLGFEIEREVPVHRWEVWERLRTNGRRDSATEDPAPSAG